MVMDEDDNIEYVIKVKTNKKGNKVYKLYYSKSEIWRNHVRGMLAIKMVNTGNGMTFRFDGKDNLSELDYAELERLRILLNLERDSEDEREHKIVEI